MIPAQPDIVLSLDDYYDNNNLMDIKILSTMGLNNDDIDGLKELSYVKDVYGGYSIDLLLSVDNEPNSIRVMSYNDNMNIPVVKEGKLPANNKECLLDSRFAKENGYKIGDEITLYAEGEEAIEDKIDRLTYTVSGLGDNPMYFAVQRGTTTVGNGSLDGFILVNEDNFKYEAYTEAYITIDGLKEKLAYSSNYDDKIDSVVEDIEAIEKPKWYVQTRSDLSYYTEAGENADRIESIGKVFPILFFLVAALISLTTMTRMVEEERTLIGVYKALGYSKVDVAMKYILYAAIATLGGSILGILIGEKVLPMVIVGAYQIVTPNIKNVIIPYQLSYGITATLAAFISIIGATIFACNKVFKSSPAVLMRPVPHRNGKRIFLERITIIWKKLNFSNKATLRNLFRYKKRFLMTVFGIGACMALMIVGYGIKDSVSDIAVLQFKDIFLYDITFAYDNENTDSKEIYKNSDDDAICLEKDDRIDDYISVYIDSLSIEKDNKNYSFNLNVTDDKEKYSNFVTFRDRRTKESYKLEDDGAVITEKIANMLDIKVGDDFTFNIDEDNEATVHISAIAENYMGHNLYMTKEYYEKITKYTYAPNLVEIKAKDKNVAALRDIGEDYLSNDAIVSVNYTLELKSQVDDMLSSMNTVILVLVVSAGLLAFVVLYNLNNININERRRELASLKVLGFYNTEVANYVYRENVILTVLGCILGVILGRILHGFVIVTVEIDTVMFSRNIYTRSFIYSLLFTLLFALIVNVVMYFKLKKINMVESLKSVE